jgi:hypothetical protein
MVEVVDGLEKLLGTSAGEGSKELTLENLEAISNGRSKIKTAKRLIGQPSNERRPNR